MGAAPAYYIPTRERYSHPGVHVVPGKRSRAHEQARAASSLSFAKVAIIALVVFTLLGFVRIGFASATVLTAMSVQDLETSIESARSVGNELEVQQTYLSNPAYIAEEASSRLGMVEAEEALTITLSEDVVVTDEAGNLSLASSLSVASEQAAESGAAAAGGATEEAAAEAAEATEATEASEASASTEAATNAEADAA